MPSFLYNAFTAKQEEEAIETTYTLLNRVFAHVEKKPLMEVAKSGCFIETIKMNSYVYREGEKP